MLLYADDVTLHTAQHSVLKLFFLFCYFRVRSVIILQDKPHDRERLLLKFLKIMKVLTGYQQKKSCCHLK